MFLLAASGRQHAAAPKALRRLDGPALRQQWQIKAVRQAAGILERGGLDGQSLRPIAERRRHRNRNVPARTPTKKSFMARTIRIAKIDTRSARLEAGEPALPMRR
jgi:hypothetical protein